MHRKILLFVFAILMGGSANAQSADSVYSHYLDFNLARFDGDQDKITELGEALIPDADKLPPKAKINFYFSIGKMYEDNEQHPKAIPYYEKVAAAEPDYYVVHRALGYLYLEKAKAIETKMNAAGNDNAMHEQLLKAYSDMAKIALPHLEKAQACDPSDETLAIIKTLYQNIKDPKGLNSLDNRLKTLSKNCVDILSD